MAGVLIICASLIYSAENSSAIAQTNVLASPPRQNREINKFGFANLYWAVPRPVVAENWHMVFGGSVRKVKSKSEKVTDDISRRYKYGEIKVERVFLDLPDGRKTLPGDIFVGEDFDGLKHGDTVIVFINAFYEKTFVRIQIAGTNTRLGFKIKSWNEPIVAAVEQATRCAKIRETTPEGHKKDFKVKMYDCTAERNEMILKDKKLADVWRQFDPQGFQYLLEMQEIFNNKE